jgi:hypothetical protein
MKTQYSVKALAVTILALSVGVASAQVSNGAVSNTMKAKADTEASAIANTSPLANAKITTVAPVNAGKGNLDEGVSASVAVGSDSAVPKDNNSAKDEKEPDNQ